MRRISGEPRTDDAGVSRPRDTPRRTDKGGVQMRGVPAKAGRPISEILRMQQNKGFFNHLSAV